MTDTEALFAMVESGDVEHVRERLTATPALATARDANGATALHHAAFDGHWDIVDLLLAHGADINARDALHDATAMGWAVHRLREHGGLLAIEIDDVLFALARRDHDWVRRLVTRHRALRGATDSHGIALAEHARATGDEALVALFEEPRSG